MKDVPAAPAVAPPAAHVIEPLVRASNAFAFALWRAAHPTGNAAVSPASLSAALTMAWGGARSATAAELQAALHLGADVDAAMTGWGQLAASLQAPARPLTLRIANQLFGDRSYRFEATYLERIRAAFGAPLEPMDFAADPEAARGQINQWVEGRTEQRIRQLLPPRSIDATTRLVLVNAIYFLAKWASPFRPISTSPRPFTTAPGATKPVPMMHQRATLRLAKQDGVRVVELPYRSDSAAMWIVLPDRLDGLAELERSLDAARFAQWTAAAQPREVMLGLPRFTIDPTTALELSTPLKELGVREAFDDTAADFTGIAVPPDPRRRLFVSHVFHKAFVKVDEEGTEAAAATAVVMAEGTGAPRPAEAVVADHPFLFAIVDRATGLVLFLGRVVDPA